MAGRAFVVTVKAWALGIGVQGCREGSLKGFGLSRAHGTEHRVMLQSERTLVSIRGAYGWVCGGRGARQVVGRVRNVGRGRHVILRHL